MAMAMLAGPSVAASAPDCETLRPSHGITVAGKRPVTPEDLVRLRDIGPQGDLAGQNTSLGVSPDGRMIAFVMRQADPVRNRYCTGLFVVAANGHGEALRLDDGGDPIFGTIDYWGIKDYPTGVAIPITPKWSADARSIAYLRRLAGRTQVRIASVDASSARTIVAPTGDIDAFGWTKDGGLVVRARIDQAPAHEALRAEGITGWRYDQRFMPMAQLKPFPASTPRHAFWTYASDGTVTPSSENDREWLNDAKEKISDSEGGASVSVTRAPFPHRSSDLIYTGPDGDVVRCQAAACRGTVVDAWLEDDGSGVAFLSREGWADEMTAAYLWSPGEAPRRVWATTDLVTDCHLVRRELICLAESSLQPRRIGAFSLDTGRSRVVFDPNPEFAGIKLAPAERLHWRNARGLPVIGDLVLPLHNVPGQKSPLVVVQYITRGFLRGGTGDEYPIQAFAAAGFAVLSFQRPADVATLYADLPPEAAVAAQFRDWADRRSVHSALMTGIDLAISKGRIDQQRIGITGLSDGASTVQFALVNSTRFKAAALSTCCQDPKTQMLMTGPATARAFQGLGYPKSTENDPAFWAPYSVAMNASRVRTPVLMQLAEDEYLAGLETYTALEESGIATELYVFPDERHIKWQPAHRLAVYTRNLAWFTRWLKTPAKNN